MDIAYLRMNKSDRDSLVRDIRYALNGFNTRDKKYGNVKVSILPATVFSQGEVYIRITETLYISDQDTVVSLIKLTDGMKELIEEEVDRTHDRQEKQITDGERTKR